MKLSERLINAIDGDGVISCENAHAIEDAVNFIRKYEDAVEQERLVPVLRCGECAYHDTADYGDGYTKNVCRFLNRQIQDDDYCSYAWRMDGDGDA